jgi:zinc protease
MQKNINAFFASLFPLFLRGLILYALLCTSSALGYKQNFLSKKVSAKTLEQQESLENLNKPIPNHYRNIEHPSFVYTPPYPQDYRVDLMPGVVAYMYPDSTLGLVDLNIRFLNVAPPRKPSDMPYRSLYSSLLKAGGTTTLSSKAIEDSLEFIASHVSASVGYDEASLSIHSLSRDIYPLMNLLQDIALKPEFEEDVFKLKQKQYMENVKHRYDKPTNILNIAYEKVLFGSHPSNWIAPQKVAQNRVRKMQSSDLNFWKGHGFHRDHVVISVAGDFKKEVMIKALRNWAQDFPTKKELPKTHPANIQLNKSTLSFPGPKVPGVYVIDQDFTQASIKIGFPGVKRPHPDYYPLTLASYIFGSGGFTSRLVAKVRTEAGLAYSVRSFVESDYKRKGTVGMSLQTKVSSTVEAISLCFSEMEQMRKSGITSQELESAKLSLIQSLPSLFSSPTATVNIFAQSEIWKRSSNHFVMYPQIIQKITKEEVERVFNKYFLPEEARIVIVGSLDKIEQEKSATLQDFGIVDVWSLEKLDQSLEPSK